MRVGYLTMEKYDNRRENSVGSSRIRGRWVMKYTPEIETFKNGQHYDAVVYQKAYWDDHMKEFDGVKIFDLCDPDWLDRRPVKGVCDLVDAITVSTPALKEFLGQMTDKPIRIIPDRIDPEEYTVRKTEHSSKIRTVVWFGYSSNSIVLDPVVNVLHDLGISLVVISERPYHSADVNIKYEYDSVNSEIIKHDAVLLPQVEDNYRHSFKSNNKTLASWALGMPVIKTYEDIERLASREAREQESEQRYNEVITDHHVRKSGQEYLDLIKEVQNAKEK